MVGRGGDVADRVRVLGAEDAEVVVDREALLLGVRSHPGCSDTTDGRTPAVHTIDAVGSSVPSRITTPRSSADATSVSVRTSTPTLLELAPRVLRQTAS